MSVLHINELAKEIEAGTKYETMGHTMLCQRAFPKPDDFDGSRESYSNSDAQRAILVWRNGDLNAAKALHEAVFPDMDGMAVYLCNDNAPVVWDCSFYAEAMQVAQAENECPARAWLLAILRALIAKHTEGTDHE